MLTKTKNVSPTPVFKALEGRTDREVSTSNYIRSPSGDICDKCGNSNEACSLRTEAHENNTQVFGCAHFRVPGMVIV